MKYILPALALFVFVACGNKDFKAEEVATLEAPAYSKSSGADSYDGAAAPTEMDESSRADATIAIKVPTHIIKTASVQFQVKNLDESHQRIKALVAKHQSYFGADNESTSTYQVDNNMTIRVQAPQFEALLDELMAESIYTNYKNVSAQDVTEEYVDIETRLKTKREVEERYRQILKEAKKVSDILEVEAKLGEIREEIETVEGRLKVLIDRVSYSTIELNIYQKLDYQPEPQIGFFSHLTEAFVRGWRGLVDVFIGLVQVWPFLIIWGVVMVFIYRRFMKKK
jgi:hypothetical protein